MAKQKVPPFRSLHDERAFWQTHDAVEVLGEESWEVVKAGETQVRSFYITRVGKQGALVHILLELLERIGIK